MPVIAPCRATPLLPGTLKNLFFPPEEGQYRYFDRALQCPFSAGDTIRKAAWAADAAMLCYARYGSRRMNDNELRDNLARGGLELLRKIGENPADWNASGTQAYFAAGNGAAILAFRGTEVDDPADAQADLDLILLPEPDYRGAAMPPLGHLAFIEHLLSLPCLVHQGFQRALNRVWSHVHAVITAYRAQHPENEICVTGHSLGGALSLLTYSRFADANMSAYTFGCPRVGDHTFRKRVAAHPGLGHHRFVNFNDLVTHVPLESALYLHAPGNCFRIDDTGCCGAQDNDILTADLDVLAAMLMGLPADFRTNLEVLEQPAPPGVVDHSPARYCMRLWDCVP